MGGPLKGRKEHSNSVPIDSKESKKKSGRGRYENSSRVLSISQKVERIVREVKKVIFVNRGIVEIRSNFIMPFFLKAFKEMLKTLDACGVVP